MIIGIKYARLFPGKRSLITKDPAFFLSFFLTFNCNSDPYSITTLLQNGIIECGGMKSRRHWHFQYKAIQGNEPYFQIITCIFFLSHNVIRRRTIPHADQLRVVSTAWHWLSHGKAWHVLRWCVRFLIRIVLELTKRFDFSVRLFSYK